MAVYTVVKKIGNTNTPTTMDYSTIQTWEDDAPADLTTSEKSAAGTFSGTFTHNESLSFSISGATGKFLETDGSSYIVYAITTGNPGAADVITGGSSGAVCTVISGTPQNVGVIWQGQCYNQGTLTGGWTISGETVSSTCYVELTTATGASFRDNASVRSNPLIYDNTKGVAIEASTTYSEPWNVQILSTRFSGLQLFNSSPGGGVRGGDIMNSCIIKTASGGSRAIRSINKVINTFVQISGGSTGILCTEAYGCTVESSGTGLLFESYGAVTLKNCAGFGGSTFASASSYTGVTYCSTDKASLDGLGATGSNNLFNQTFANQFVSTTIDFRAVNTGGLKAGTPDATNTPVDISNFTRDATTPYIGAWEVAGGGGGGVAASSTKQFLMLMGLGT